MDGLFIILVIVIYIWLHFNEIYYNFDQLEKHEYWLNL